MKNPHVVLCMERPQIVGPFQDRYQAARWGGAWQRANNDDPRWQIVDLDLKWAEENSVLITSPWVIVDPTPMSPHFVMLSTPWQTDAGGHVWSGIARDPEHALLQAIVDSMGWDDERPNSFSTDEDLRRAILSQFGEDVSELREVAIIYIGAGVLAPFCEIDVDETLGLNVPRVTHDSSAEQH